MRVSLIAFFVLFSVVLFGQTFKVSGTVTDASTGEPMPFVVIKDTLEKKRVETDFDGKYSISLKGGEHNLIFSSFTYTTLNKSIDVKSDLSGVDVRLEVESVVLEAVEISTKRLDDNVAEVEMSTEEINIEEVKKLPAFLGEVDVIKTVQLFPGVTTVGEGASGFNVRGGNIDQNLILLDGANIYSSSHLFGFFSVFNSEIVEDLKLYKGGIPAYYGGRLSSALDVNHRSGDKKEFHGSGGVGVVSSRFTLEGPIQKEKSSFIVSGRRSYADLFLNFSADSNLRKTAAYFGDLNFKYDQTLGDRDVLNWTNYYGRDVFNFRNQFGFDFGNLNSIVNWKHNFSDSTFSSTIVGFNSYSYQFNFQDFLNWKANVNNTTAQYHMEHILDSSQVLKYGIESNYYWFSPAEIDYGTLLNEAFPDTTFSKEYALENAVYVQHKWNINKKITLLSGLRYSQYLLYGPVSSNQYLDGEPLELSNVTGQTTYQKGDVVQFYHGLEPRMGLKIGLDSVSSIKTSFMRTRQNIHLISNTTNGLPIDMWKSADEFVKPATANQYVVGYFRNLKDNLIETSVEVYYKTINDILDYKNGADLLLNETIETELLQGLGRAYGMELMVRKKKGDLTGWVAYTLSRTERKIDGEDASEKVNNGDWYKSNYDKPHDLTIVGTYEFSDRFSMGTNFTLATGRPISYPDSRYTYEGFTINNNLLRNQDRIPTYHRWDLSATLKNKKKSDDQRWESSWAFSIYNVYGRRNAFSVTVQENGDTGELEATRLSILGTVLPAFTYNFSF